MALFGLTRKEDSDWDKETQQEEKQDWTHFLSGDAVGLLRSILEAAYKHRTAYFKAEDIKNAQLWSAMLEMQRQINELSERVGRLEPRHEKVYRTSLADDTRVKDMITEATKPSAQDSKGATDALVNSLLRF